MQADDGELVMVGLIADPQYADIDDAWMTDHGTVRRYRSVLPLVVRAVDRFNADGVTVVVQLGDIVDGANAKKVPPESATALSIVLTAFNKLVCGEANVHHLVGNNERRNFPWLGKHSPSL